MTTDQACLDWLDGLRDRYEMIPCARSRQNTAGLRRLDCETDIHVRAGRVSIYVRDANGNVVVDAYETTVRAAIAKAAVELDHIKPLHQGGTNDDANLQGLCVECHRIKTATERVARQRARFDSSGMPITQGHHWL